MSVLKICGLNAFFCCRKYFNLYIIHNYDSGEGSTRAHGERLYLVDCTVRLFEMWLGTDSSWQGIIHLMVESAKGHFRGGIGSRSRAKRR